MAHILRAGTQANGGLSPNRQFAMTRSERRGGGNGAPKPGDSEPETRFAVHGFGALFLIAGQRGMRVCFDTTYKAMDEYLLHPVTPGRSVR